MEHDDYGDACGALFALDEPIDTVAIGNAAPTPTPRPILYEGEEERLARIIWHVSEDWGTIDLNAEDRAFGDSEPFMQLARAIIDRLRGEA